MVDAMVDAMVDVNGRYSGWCNGGCKWLRSRIKGENKALRTAAPTIFIGRLKSIATTHSYHEPATDPNNHVSPWLVVITTSMFPQNGIPGILRRAIYCTAVFRARDGPKKTCIPLRYSKTLYLVMNTIFLFNGIPGILRRVICRSSQTHDGHTKQVSLSSSI